jgi:hypothetical protein
MKIQSLWLKMSLKPLIPLAPAPEYRSRIIQAICLCVLVLYGYRALQVEILRLAFFAVPINLCFGGLVLAGVVYWFILLFHGVRAMATPRPNGVLLFVVIIGAFLAWYTPEPPLREEAKLFFDRSRYEEIAEQGRSTYLAGKYDCIELADQDQDLARTCVLVEGNHAVFRAYPGIFLLVYSYDEHVPTAADCREDWNGSVWKRIDKNWFICKSNIN